MSTSATKIGQKYNTFTLLILGIWTGMIIGISFMEAPLKFQAPNITLELGLGIGKLVFGALNKFELLYALLLTIWIGKHFKILHQGDYIAMSIPILLVIIQTAWLFPILTERIELILAGEQVPNTYHHILYIITEVIKLIFLIVSFLKVNRLNNSST